MKRYSIIVPFGALLLFLIATLPAQSQVVIMNGNTFLAHNDAGDGFTNPNATTTFNPKTCLWVVNNSQIRCADENGNGKGRYLRTNTPINLDNNASTWGSVTDGTISYTSSGKTYYLRYTNNSWTIARNGSTSNNGGAKRVTISNLNQSDEEVNYPVISINAVDGAKIQLTHSGLSGIYYYACKSYEIANSDTYYLYDNNTYKNTRPSLDASDLNPTYTWSITSGGDKATIDSSTGQLTLADNLTDGTITVNLAITGISPLNNKDITYTITAQHVPQLKEAESEDMYITPSECTLDLGESFTFQAPSSVANVTTYTRNAYTSITTIDGTLYLVNGRLETEEPSIYTEHLYDVPFSYFRWSIQQTGGYYVAIDDNCYYNAESNLGIVHRQEQLSSIPTTATLTVTGVYGGATLTAQATINIPPTYVDIDGVSCGGLNLVYGQSGTLTPNTWTSQNGAKYIELIYSSDNESVATVTQDGVVTATGVGQVNITIQSVRRDGTTQGAPSCVVNLWINKATLAAPTIDISPNGQVTITDNNDPSIGATIYYTTDGRLPAYSETRQEWNGNTFTVPNMATVMAVAIANDNYNNSAVSSKQHLTTGIDSNAKILYIDDLEDHTWTYYSGKPDGDYPDNLTSPDPRNVVITYNGGWVNGGTEVAVSTTENVNKFVYYKTIEKKAWGQDEGRWLTGNYAYQVIPNPFSKRPAVTNGNNKTYYGFGGWKITSGGEYISGYDNNQVLPLDAKINFINLDNNYTPNCISAQIVFEATWVAATVVTVNANVTGDHGLPAGGTYETNFIVVSGNDRTVTGMSRNATVMGCYPDGSGATGARLSTVTGSANDLKIENINLGDGSKDFTANTGWLIVGRGCTGNVRRVIGNTGQIKMRIESGLYNFIHPMSQNTESNSNYGLIVFGCDYDRATNDGLTSNDQYADNSTHRKLRVINYVSLNGNYADKASDDDRSEYMDITIKSGYFGYSADFSKFNNTLNANGQDGVGLGIGGNTDNLKTTYSTYDRDNNPITYNVSNWNVDNTTDYRWQKLLSFYCGRTRGGHYGGINRVLVEGGELGSINGGGYRNTGNNFDVCYHFRMKGGWVKGAIYGTASSSQTNATTKQVITGGEINGWIAGACNGTDVDNAAGENLGDTYIYLGGNAQLRSHRKDGKYNNAWGLVGGVEGGNIFASGRGTPATNAQPTRNYCGSSYKTYVVVADESEVEQNVCGGGYIGVAQNSHIYITGGQVGNVYGGSMTPTSTNNTWMTQTTDIRQYGGTVKGGIYGGHYQGTGNAGKIHQTTSVQIIGGQVGTDADNTANIHGGGFGSGTTVGGNVTVTIGSNNADITPPDLYGDVYGGSALGTVNTNAQNQTNVILNAGTVNGSIYGGGLGDQSTAADVNGAVAVTVNGGSVTGGVFGGNNINGMPKSTIAVTVNGSDIEPAPGEYAINAVYGGGNMAPYTGNPAVKIQGGNIENVYGGGLGTTAVITGNTGITMTGGKAGSLFGGGSQANVTGSVTINMQGGQIVDDIYGGGALANTNTTSGTTTVNLTGGQVYNVFGGGLGDEDHYAQVGGNVQVLLNQGVADNAKGCIVDNAIFGCNNVNGTPLGTVTVHIFATQHKYYSSILLKPDKNLDKTLNQGDHDIKAVYGGGNMAAYRPTQANTPTHVIIDGCGKTSIEYVYGGGNAAPVPATQVDINGSYQIANVFGGGNGKDALPNGDPNPGADVGIYEVDQNTFNSTTAKLRYDDPGNEKDDDQYYIMYGDTANASVIGTTQVYILGGVVSQVFGGSNTKGDIVKEAKVILGDENLAYCEFSIGGVYGGSNEAYMSGSAAIDMHCIEGMDEIYGGSKKADISKDVVLTINGGRYGKVFGGNNISGRINGSITINIEQTGCLPIEIGELYGGGNQAPYSIYGYDGTEIGDDGVERPIPLRTPQQGVEPHHDPVINIVSCQSIGTVYGGGFKALMVGSPEININMVRGWVNGRYQSTGAQDPNRQYQNAGNMDHLGTIGTVYGGGNQAEVVGSTHVNIGTESDVQVHDITKAVYDVIKTGRTDITNPSYTGGADQTKDLTIIVEGANITDNIYGGGNNASVTGQTFITVGPAQ